MDIHLDKLAAQMIQLLFDEEGRDVRLGPTGPLRGRVEQRDGRYHFSGHVELATVLSADWRFDGGTRLRMQGPVVFRQLQGSVAMTPRGPRVSLAAASVELPALEIAAPAWTLRFQRVHLRDAELHTGGDEPTRIAAEDAVAEHAELVSGSTPDTLLGWGPVREARGAGSGDRPREKTMSYRPIGQPPERLTRPRRESASEPGGRFWAGNEPCSERFRMTVAALDLDEVDFDAGRCDAAGLSGRTVRLEAHMASTAPAAGSRPPIDWARAREALDRLDGRIDVTVETGLRFDAGWPVVGRHRMQHRIGLDIREGRVAAPDLEDCLSPLEDAVLDFRFSPDQLRLVAGWPSLASRELVAWSLTEAERHAAERDAALPLSRWLQPESPTASPTSNGGGDDDEGGLFHLDELLVRDAHADVTYAGRSTVDVGDGQLRLGTEHGPPFSRLATALSWQLRPAGDGRLTFEGDQIHLGARSLPLSPLRVDLARLDVARLDEGRCAIRNGQLGEVAATGRSVRLRELHLRWPTREDESAQGAL